MGDFFVKKVINYISIQFFGIIFFFLFFWFNFKIGVLTIPINEFCLKFGLKSTNFLMFICLIGLYFAIITIFNYFYKVVLKEKYSMFLYVLVGVIFDQIIRLAVYIISNEYLYENNATFLSLLTLHIFLIIFNYYSIYYSDFISYVKKKNYSLPEPIHDKYN